MSLQEYHKVWAVMIFGWIANYMVRSGLAPVLIPIRQELNLTYAQAGWIASALFYAYAGMLFPAGHLGDRFGRKIVLVACTFWWAVSSFLTGFAESFAALFLFRFLTGLGQGSYFSNDRPIISHYTPKEKQGFGQSFSFIGLGTGMFLGYVLAGIISSSMGWRYVFYLFSLPSFAAGFLILRLVREPEPNRTAIKGHPDVSYSILFKNRDLWMLYVGGIPGVYAVWMAGTWGPAMFQDLGVGTLALSSVLSGLVGISAIPGLLMTGWISDIMVRNRMGRKGLIGIQFGGIALLMVLMGTAIRLKWSPLWAAVIIFCIGFFAWGHWGAFYALISDIVPNHIQGTCYGFTNSLNFIGALIAPPLTGWIKDITGSFEQGCYLSAAFIFIGSLFILNIRPAFRLKPESPVFPVR